MKKKFNSQLKICLQQLDVVKSLMILLSISISTTKKKHVESAYIFYKMNFFPNVKTNIKIFCLAKKFSDGDFLKCIENNIYGERKQKKTLRH